MTRRLLLSYLLVVVGVLIVLEVPLAVLTQRYEEHGMTAQATTEAQGLAVSAGEDLEHHRSAELNTLVSRYRVASGSEVLIVSPDGTAILDSDNDGAADVAELRPQIETALQSTTTTTHATDEGVPFAIAAVPLHPDDSANDAKRPPSGVLVLSLSARNSINRVHQIWLGLGAVAVAIIGISVLVGARLARSVTRPLAALEAAVEQFGRGQLGERAPRSGPDELQRLADQFNAMASRLQDLLSAQSRFVSDASHQLRTPLTAIRLRIENLEADTHGEIADALTGISREVDRLSRIVDGLLALGRADAEEPERQPVGIAAVVRDRGEMWAPLADERGVHLRIDAKDEGTVELVPGDLEQILDNLLANALDATPPGRSITLATDRSDMDHRITVTDQGHGMSEEERAHAFDRFWQGPRNQGGSSGLGLAIVAQLARRNDAIVQLSAPIASDNGTSDCVGLQVDVLLPA